MTEAYLEHANLTVKDPDETAQMLVELFGWRVRWAGDAIYGGYSVHVGGEQSYLALYALKSDQRKSVDSYRHLLGLNHLGIVVDDLDTAEQAVIAAGFKPHSHADYEPGNRFYFKDNDEMEFEVICYR